MMRAMKWLACLLLFGCGASDGANPDAKCNPLAVGDCLLPWPSSFYLKSDSTTATGVRVALPEGVLPLDQTGKSMSPARLNLQDGFSPAGALVANLKVRLERTQLPPLDDPSKSMAASSTVQLVRWDTGERVPLFAEVDNNALPDEDQVLLIHPLVRLQPKTRYVVALRGLVDENRKRVRNAPFDALVAGPSDARLVALQPRYREIFAKLTAAGVAKHELTLAWDFTTASDELILSHLIAMRDAGLDAWEKQDLGYSISPVDVSGDDHLLMRFDGTFQVPSFLESDDPKAVLKLDGNQPVLRGVQAFNVVVTVPKCAATATRPLPFLVYGHGLFGSTDELTSGYQKALVDQLCMIEVGTNWIGLSGDDIPNVASTVVPDFSHFDLVTDRLQQSQVNFLVLARLALRKLKNDPRLVVHGHPITDGSEIYYYGCSQGGIEGGTFLGLSPDVVRGALNVAGGEYSLMLTRSADFATLKHLLDITYPSQRDQEVLLALSQSYWDYSDPISFAPYSLTAPLPDPTGAPLPLRRILLQEAIDDGQVPNVATRVAARTLGLPQLEPPVENVYGLTVKAAPLDSAYTQWNVDPMPAPGPTNTPPKDNPAHETIRRLPRLIDQLAAFFRPDGQVTQTCAGPCVFAQ
jgi:hypothetical protein